MAEETPSAGGGSIGTARIDVTVNTATMEAGVEAAKRKVSGLGTEAAAQFDKANAATKKYADSLSRQVELVGKSRLEQIAYNAEVRIGGERGAQIAAAALAKQAQLNGALGATGKSAKELEYALRGVPAQLTDIFTGLATGQRPLTLFLQQGGQLKDMFGGIAPAAKALGSSLLSLVNPFTIAAAAAAGLFIAWKEGSDEAVAYNKALLTTGSYAGVTAGQLQTMASNIARVTGTQHEAAAALAEVAGSGRFTAEQIGLVGRAAVAMSELTGQATSETIKQFQELGEKPVEAILKLNATQHFLTSAIYEQIKALDDQGRAEEAAQLAMQTYSDTVEKRRAAVVENLGLIEESWRGIKNATLEAADAALSVGRARSDQQKFDALVENRNAAKDLIDRGMGASSFYGTTAEKYYQDATQKLLAMADDRAAKEKEQAKKAAADRLVQDKADSDRQAAAYFTNAEKRAREYLKAKNEFNARIARATKAGDGKLAEQERQQKAAVLAGINAKYADKRHDPFSDSITGDPRANLTSSIAKEIDGFKKEADQWARSTSAAVAYRQTLQDMLDTRQRSIDLQVASIGMGQREIEQQSALIAIDQDYDRKKADLQKRQQDATSQLDRDGYQQQLDDLAKYHDARIRMELDGFKREEKARKDATLGAQKALADFTDSAGDVAGQTADLFGNAFEGMSDAIAKFVQTGRLDFSELATSIIADLAKMEARILVSQALQSVFGGYGGTNGQGGVTYNDQGFVNHVYAKGGVVDGSANLSAYSGRVVDRPTLFAFAKGNGLMGEAGPEAILPLRRGADGKLGVASSGSVSGDVQVVIENHTGVQPQVSRSTGPGGQDVIKVLLKQVDQRMAQNAANPSSDFGKAMKGTYGLQRRGVPVGG